MLTNASILLGHTEAIRRRPHGFGRGRGPDHSREASSCNLAKPERKPPPNRIVGVVVKTLVFPEAVDVRWNIPNTRAATTELGDMLICDL